MKTNAIGQQFIKVAEGLIGSNGKPALSAYLCQASVLTIGWGHTRNVSIGLRITVEEAQMLFEEDVLIHEKIIEKYVKVPLNENQFSALVSWVFTLGESKQVIDSDLFKAVNAKKFDQVPFELKKWVYFLNAKTKKMEVSSGLKNRRDKEAGLFAKPLTKLVN